MTIRLLLVDDHPVVRDGLSAALSQGDIIIIGAVGSVAEAERALATSEVDIAMVDVRLPDGSGLELVARECTREHHPQFIVISSSESPRYAESAFQIGAAGFLSKRATTTDMIDAIRRVAAGGIVFDPRTLARRPSDPPLRAVDRSVVSLIVDGRTNDEIAGHLGVSSKTVERSITRIFAETGVLSRTELAVKAEREGWLDLPTQG